MASRVEVRAKAILLTTKKVHGLCKLLKDNRDDPKWEIDSTISLQLTDAMNYSA